MADFYATYPVGSGSGGGGGGVTSLNGLTGILDITSSTLSVVPSGASIAIDAQGNPNQFASFDNSGNLESAPGWSLDQTGQAFVQSAGTFPSDSYTSLQISPGVSTPLTGGYEGVIVGVDFSSTMTFQSSYNVENTYESTYVNSGGIGQYQDQSNFNAGATSGSYSSFAAFPTIAGTTNYTAFGAGPTLTNTTSGDTLISIGANLNSGYTNSGGFIVVNDATNLKVGASANNYSSYNADPNLNGTITTSYSGLSISPNINSIFPSFNGVSISPNNGALPSSSMTGFDCNFGNFMSLPYMPTGLDIDQGVIQTSATLDTQFVTPDSVYGINNIGGLIQVSSGFPIAGGQFGFGNNIGIGLIANDDINVDSTGVDLGFSSVGFVTQIEIAAGKTVSTLNMMAAGAGIPPSSSGAITNASLFRALGFLPEGGTLAITNLYGFKSDPVMAAIGATNTWGFYEGSGSDNYFTKIALGTTSQKVTNSSVALELGGSTRALRLSNLTTTQRDALTPLAGMEIFNITTNAVEFYNGAAWIGGSSPVLPSTIPQWTKYTFSFSDFSTAGTEKDVSVFSLGTKQLLCQKIMKTSAAFTGGAISSYMFSVGFTNPAYNDYLNAYEGIAAPGDTNYQNFGNPFAGQTTTAINFGAPLDIRIKANSVDDNLDQATTGSVDVWVQTLTLP